MKTNNHEAMLGARVVAWLESQGWDVYQEVEIARQGRRADIVAMKDRLVIVVELKTSLTFDLLAQARRWRQDAHHVYAAVPCARSSDGRRAAFDVFESNGVGVLTVSTLAYVRLEYAINVERAPMLNRKANADLLRSRLFPEHKTATRAGSPAGGHSTDFSRTISRIKSFVLSNPGATLRQALENVDHHYASVASARAAIVKLIRAGVIKGLVATKQGREHVLSLERDDK